MSIEEQLAELEENAKFVESRILARIRDYSQRRSQANAHIQAQMQLAMELDRQEREEIVRDITGYSEEKVTGIEYERLPRMFYEPKLPHQEDELKLYGEAAE